MTVGHVVQLVFGNQVLLVGPFQLLNTLITLSDDLLNVFEGVILLHQLFNGGFLDTLEERVDVIDVLDQVLILYLVLTLLDLLGSLVEDVLVDELFFVHVLQLLFEHH